MGEACCQSPGGAGEDGAAGAWAVLESPLSLLPEIVSQGELQQD